MYADIKSLHGNKYAQLYTQKNGFAVYYPMLSINENKVGYTLTEFCNNFGVPNHLTFDGHPSQVGNNTLFLKTIKKNLINYHVSQPYKPSENPAESSIREVKRKWYMMKKYVSKRLWD